MMRRGDDPADVMRLMQSDSYAIMQESDRMKDTDMTDWESYADELEERIVNPNSKISGITSGIDTIDLHFGGWQPGDFVVVMAWTSVGKLQHPSTPIPTPRGWVKAGDIRPGDEIFGSDGKPTTVTHTWWWDDQQMYKVKFNDGAEIVVGENHDWSLLTAKRRESKKFDDLIVKSTKELYEDGVRFSPRKKGNNKAQYKFYLPLTGPVEYPEVELPLDPYALGTLLGDGHFGETVTMNCNDTHIRERVVERIPYRVLYDDRHEARRAVFYSDIKGPITDLNLMGVKSRDKFIPDIYLMAHVEARKELLYGLMDADGGVKKNSRPKFHSYSKSLAYGVKELVLSLGGVARVKVVSRKDGDTEYCVDLWTPFNPFTLPRKANLCNPKFDWFRAIESIEELDIDRGVCFTVSADDSLYIAGEDYIVTHNSSLTRLFAANAWRAGYRPLIISLEMDKEQEMARMHTILNAGERFTGSQLMSGQNIDINNYRDWARETFEGKQPIHLVTSEGVDSADQFFVQAKIDQYKPDLVVLDYHTLFEDGRGGRGETESAKNLSKDFKRIALRNRVPIIDVTGVTMDDGHNDRPPELNEIAWSKQLSYDADMVLAIHREPDSELFHVVTRKTRRCPPFAFYLRWNLDTGKWTEGYG